MTLSAVRTGCNQSSSRDPLTDYDEPAVETTLRRLKDRQLVRIVWSDTGRRTLKYHQLLSEVLELDDAQRALVTVLLLRGAQAPGELGPAPSGCTPSRTAGPSRWCSPTSPPGPSRSCASCRASAASTTPAGCTSSATSSSPTAPVAEAAPAVDRESVLASGAAARDERVRASYDAVARLLRRLAGRPSWPACRSRPGCSTGSPPTPTADRWSRSAADRATSRPTSPRRAPTRAGSTCRPAWSRRPGAGSPTATTGSATSAG